LKSHWEQTTHCKLSTQQGGVHNFLKNQGSVLSSCSTHFFFKDRVKRSIDENKIKKTVHGCLRIYKLESE
jgi:hypothetical protein